MADRKISDLTALTTPATGDLIPIVDVSEAAAADKNKSITVGELLRGAPDGTAAAPGIAFESDGGNGMFLGGTDILAFSTGGSQALTINASQQVGIGDNSPDRRLHVRNDGNYALKVGGESGSPYYLELGQTGASASPGINYTGTSAGLKFSNDGDEVARFDLNGRLGIGETSPESLLHLKGSNATLKIESSVNTGYSGVEFDRAADDTHFAIYAYDSSHPNHANNVQFYGYQAGRLDFHTNSSASPRLSIASDGNVGINTTSPGLVSGMSRYLTLSAAGSGEAVGFELKGNRTGGNQTNARISFINDSSETARINSSYQGSTTLGSLEFYTSGSERAQIDANGRLLLGTASPRSWLGVNSFLQVEATGYQGASQSWTLNQNSGDGVYLGLTKSRGSALNSNTLVADNDTLGAFYFNGTDGSAPVAGAAITGAVDGTPSASVMPGRLVFSTNGGSTSLTERGRIIAKGYAKFSNNGTYRFADNYEHEFSQHQASNWSLRVANHHASQTYGIVIDYPNANPNTNDYYFLYAVDNTAVRFYVNSNGGIANYQANDANLCDEREKKNIEPLDSTWGCLKNWDLKKFHYNEDADTDDKKYGVIAQQVAPHCPEVITDWVKQKAEDAVLDDDGNVVTPAKEEITRMAVKEQQMMWMAIKALQEAQTRIEELEAKVAALEAG